MSGLLIAIGAIVAVLGLGSVGYGIPVKEFSFGNTLIVSGTIAVIGGLIVVAIGAAIMQMRRLAELLAHMSVQPAAPAHSFETPTAAAAPVSQPVPFPPRPKPERVEAPELHQQTAPPPRPAKPAAPPPPFPAADDRHMAPAPVLRNPDAPLPLSEQFEIPEHEGVSLSPPSVPAALPKDEPLALPPAVSSADTLFAPPREHRPEPPSFGEQPLRAPPPLPPASFPPADRPAQPSYFDSMWPSEAPPAKRTAAEEQRSESRADFVTTPQAPTEPAAILKSGVVDGMAYTLYVDGSIEAELPSGVVRFASITELREHLAKGA